MKVKTRGPYWVPKRRVSARLQFDDRRFLTGDLYVDVASPDGKSGRVVDRLNDPSERWVPLAVENRHLLLNKASIVTVELPVAERESDGSVSDERTLHLRVVLSTGYKLEGRIPASLSEPRARVLDFLNLVTQRFLAVSTDDTEVLVNANHVKYVIELAER